MQQTKEAKYKILKLIIGRLQSVDIVEHADVVVSPQLKKHAVADPGGGAEGCHPHSHFAFFALTIFIHFYPGSAPEYD